MATTEEAVRRLAIESRSTGLDETTAKLNAMSTAHEGVAVASQKSEKATQSMQARLNSIQRQYDSVYRAEQNLARVERDLAAAQGQGLITSQRRLELLSLAAEKHGLATSAINREIGATERLANVQRAQMAANQNMRGLAPINTANIAAQFQDIGVTAAMGMNPLQIALQQGTQLSAVLGPMGAAGAVRSLGAAFVSIINPVSLVTLGLVGLTAAAIQYFMKSEDGSEKIDAALQKQQELIAGVAKRWGDAVPAIKAYNDEVERTKELEDALKAAGILGRQQYEGSRSAVSTLTSDMADLVSILNRAGVDQNLLVTLQHSWDDLQKKVSASTATSADARMVQQDLLALLQSTGIPIISDYADEVGTLAQTLADAAAASSKFREEAALLKLNESLPPLNQLNVFRSTPFQTEEEIMFERSRRQREAEVGRQGGIGIPTPTPRPNDIERLDLMPNAQDYLRTQRESLEMLQAEIGLVGQSEAARTRQIAVLQVEQEIRRRGIDLYGVEANEMRANAVMQIELSQQLATLKKQEIESAQASKKIYEDVYGYANDQLQKLIDGTFTWRDALKSLIPVLLNILNALATGNGGTSIGGFLNNLNDLLSGKGIGSTNAGLSFSQAGGGIMKLLSGDGSGLVAANSNVAASGSMAVYQRAIKAIESLGSGGYSAIGPTHPTLGRALGAYQVMEANIGPWSKAAIGRSVSSSEFLADPSIQDTIFNHKFGSYVEKYGPSGAASMWFTGKPSAPNATDVLGTSGAGYVEKFNAQLAKLGGTAEMATKGLGGFAGGLGSLAQQLSSIAGGSGGGWASNLMSLFGGAGGAVSHMMSISPLATKFILGGGVGLFAEGGVSDRPAIFGEAGAEAAVPLSRGRYIPVEMKGPRMSGPTGVKVDVGVSVDGEGNLRAYVKNVVQTDAKQIARGEAAGILSNYDYAQKQGGSAGADQRYGALKAGRRN